MPGTHADQADLPAGFPQPRRRLRLGLVGGGPGSFIGPVHANGARLSGRWEVVAGALSSRPEVARTAGADWFFAADRCYADFREMAEREAARPDGIDAVAITTPNDTHYPIARAFMERGIDVISDKPVTTTLADALDLLALQRRTGLVFGVTYSYSGHAMVRQMRQMIAEGAIGAVRQVHVEFFQDWAMNVGPAWRLDPARSGASFTTADIGTHAHHLARFVLGREMTELRATFHVSGSPKPMEDTAFMQVRFGAIPGTLMVSQAAAGTECGLRIRVFGETAGLSWEQETPELLRFAEIGQPPRLLSRGTGAGIGSDAARLVRMPRGQPEALTDAWANLYTEFGVAVDARRNGTHVPDGLLHHPTLREGVEGMAFVEAAIRSDADGGAWVDCRLPPDADQRDASETPGEDR